MSTVERFAGIHLTEILSAARQYWRSSVGMFVAGIIALLGVLVLWPNKYLSDAQILVRLGRGSLAVDPTSTVTPTVSLQETRLTQVNSVKEMLLSRAMIERVVDRVGVEPILAPQSRLEEWMLRLQSILPKFGGGTPSSSELTPAESVRLLRREEAVQKVYKQFDVTVPKNAYTIYLSVQNGSPFVARDIIDAILVEYGQYHVQAHRFGDSLAFFENQSTLAYDAAVEAQEKVRDTKNRMGVLEIDSARSALRSEISQLERDLAQSESESAAVAAEITELQSSLASIDTRVDAETLSGITKQTGDGMRQQVFNLEMQEKQLSAQLTDNHPRVRAVREQLEKSREIARTERGEQPQTRETINPVWQNLELTRRSSLAKQSGLESKRETLKDLLRDANKRLEQLNADAVELTRLTWEASIAESTYLRNAHSREQARLLAALDKDQFSEISVIQPASLILKKISPPRSILAVLGTFALCVFTVFVALLRGALATAKKPGVVEHVNRAMVNPSTRARYDGGWGHDEIEHLSIAKPDDHSEKGILSPRIIPR